MAQGDIIVIGSDQLLTLALLNSAGSALDLSAVGAVAVYLIQGKSKVVARYCTEDMNGQGFTDGKLTILSAAGGTLELILDREVTWKMEEGKLYYRAEVQTTAAEFEESRSNVESTGLALVAEMVKGGTKKISLT